MKTLKINFLTTLLLVLSISTIQAQDALKKYWVHEDVVKPSMVTAYETICKELTSNLKKHNIQSFNTIVTNSADHRYLWVSPISSMADIDRPIFKTLAEKMGADKMSALFDKMDECYDIEHNYVIQLDEELSYMPGGITQTPEGRSIENFITSIILPQIVPQ